MVRVRVGNMLGIVGRGNKKVFVFRSCVCGFRNVILVRVLFILDVMLRFRVYCDILCYRENMLDL